MPGRALLAMHGVRKFLLRVALGLLLLLVVGLSAALLLAGRFDPRYAIGDWRALLHAASGLGGPAVDPGGLSQGFTLPPGLSATVFASQLPHARLLHLTTAGDLLVSQPRGGQITWLLRDADGDGRADGQEVLIANLDRPHGIDVHEGWLYVAEGDAVGRVRFDPSTGKLGGAYQRILAGIPSGGNHWTRTLRAGKDGWIYLSIGSSCNACVEQHPWRAAIIRFRPDGSAPELHASGLRDPDAPPIDPALAARARPPAHPFGAHTAPLGIRFLRSASLQARYGRAALVALHGSWNRTVPAGYRLALLQWQPDGSITEQAFMTGFRRQDEVLGRPVDIVESAWGELFISDDYAGVVYRLAAGKPAAAAGLVPGSSVAAAAEPSHLQRESKPLDTEARHHLQQFEALHQRDLTSGGRSELVTSKRTFMDSALMSAGSSRPPRTARPVARSATRNPRAPARVAAGAGGGRT